MKTPEEIMVEAAKPLRAKALGTRTIMHYALEALDAAGYVIVSRRFLTALKASFPVDDYHDTPPGI